jgi:hypothetical protein
MMKTESTFWDHSQRWKWNWFFQMVFNKNVYFYYDFKKKCFCRKVTHVEGEVRWNLNTWQKEFHPYPHKIINYIQWI